MRNHCITLKECASRGGDVSLVVDPEATKRLELRQDYDIAMRIREEERQKFTRVKSNQTKPLAEPPSTRITRSRKTVPVGTSCSISVDDSDHRYVLSYRNLVGTGLIHPCLGWHAQKKFQSWSFLLHGSNRYYILLRVRNEQMLIMRIWFDSARQNF
jgi:hypothetical protein